MQWIHNKVVIMIMNELSLCAGKSQDMIALKYYAHVYTQIKHIVVLCNI